MKLKAEISVKRKLVHAMQHQRLLGNFQELSQRHGRDSPPASEGANTGGRDPRTVRRYISIVEKILFFKPPVYCILLPRPRELTLEIKMLRGNSFSFP